MNQSKKKKSSFKLSTIKYYALKLRNTYQLPYKLVYYINNLNADSGKDEIQFLSALTEHYLRLKGYYKKYPDIEGVYNEEIEKAYADFLSKRNTDSN